MAFGGDGAGCTVRGSRSGGALDVLPVPETYSDDVGAGARAFVDAVLGVGPASPDFTDGYEAQRVVDAALHAAVSGRGVRL